MLPVAFILRIEGFGPQGADTAASIVDSAAILFIPDIL